MKKLTAIVKYFVAAIFFAYVALSLLSFWIADEQRLVDIFEDDAYYYFKIADNLRDGRGLTFDGQTITNGFQPVWLVALLPIFLIWEDPLYCLRVVGTFSILLTGLTGFLGIRYLFKAPLHVFLISAVFFLMTLVSISNTGMETAVLLPLVIAALIHFERIGTQGEKKYLVAGLLSLALLARLDIIFLVLTILLILLTGSWRDIWIVIVPGVAIGVYLGANLFLTGHLIPTSGVAKSLRSDGQLFNLRFFHQLVTINNPVDGNTWIVFALVFVVSLAMTSFFILNVVRSRSFKVLERTRIQWVVASFITLYTMYYLFMTSWVLWRWYSYPLILFSIFLLPFLIESVFTRFEPYPVYSRAMKRLLTVASLILIVYTSGILLKQGIWARTALPSFKYPSYIAAKRLNEDLSPSSILAMGDRAGSFAYFLDSDLLQLEGLLGDYELIQAIEADRLIEYMDDFGVDYIAAFTEPPQKYDEWDLLSPLPDLTIGPNATIPLCQESQYPFAPFQGRGIYLWNWPSCGG